MTMRTHYDGDSSYAIVVFNVLDNQLDNLFHSQIALGYRTAVDQNTCRSITCFRYFDQKAIAEADVVHAH